MKVSHFKQLEEAMNQGKENEPKIGAIVGMFCPAGQSIEPDRFFDIATVSNYPEEFLPKRPDGLKACKKAVASLKTKWKKRGVEIEKLRDERKKILYSIGFKSKDEYADETVQDAVAYKHMATITYDKVNEQWNEGFIDQQMVSYFEELKRVYKEKFNMSNEDLSHSFLSMATKLGIPFLPGNSVRGTYFIPQEHATLVWNLKGMLEQIDDRNFLQVMTIRGSEENVESMGNGAKLSLQNEIESLYKKIEKLGETSRESTFDSKRDEISKLEEKVKLFANCLNFQAQDLIERLESVGGTLNKKEVLTIVPASKAGAIINNPTVAVGADGF